MSDVLERLTPIFRRLFEDPGLTLGRSDSASTVVGWDSLAHGMLISAVEKEFKVRFALGELRELENVGDMIDLIEQRLAKR